MMDDLFRIRSTDVCGNSDVTEKKVQGEAVK